MPNVTLSLGKNSYDVHVSNGSLDSVGFFAARARLGKRAALITDANVYPKYGESVRRSLEAADVEVSVHVITAGEEQKSLSQVEKLVSEMVTAGHNRSSFVVALGGGVVGDLAGFVASVFYRGIPYVQLPTSVLAQVDSSIGGKTAVNIPAGKNLIGAFHQPRFVLADPISLLTLSPRDLREGMAEMVKHAAIRKPKMLVTLRHIAKEVPLGFSLRTIESLPEVIAENIEIKARIVEEDEHETSGVRAFLNFGHTLGHGIEASLPYGQLRHGEAVSLGMRAALFLSRKHLGLQAQEEREVLETLAALQQPLVLPEEVDPADVMEHTAADKKFDHGKIRFVLLRALGDPVLSTEITREDLQEAIAHLTTPVSLN